MKKLTIPALFFVLTLAFCLTFNPSIPAFRGFEKSGITASPLPDGCEISCRGKRGLVKKYVSRVVSLPCEIKTFDFNGDGKKEVFIYDGKNGEIVNFYNHIPLAISKKEDFYPLSLRFTKNDNSVTAHLENGQTFDLFPKDLSKELIIEKTAKVSITDFNADNISDLCITQRIINSDRLPLYTVNTFRSFDGHFFVTEKITVEAVK